MRLVFSLMLIVSLLCLSVSGVLAWPQGKQVTPYGDFSPQCGKYGACNTIMTDYDAEKALKDYYNKKGLNVEIGKKGGRFLRARIYDKTGIVDIIIFDRQTGRIRSIF